MEVMIVDNSAVVRKVARRILEGMNFNVTDVSGGAQALAACSLSMPDAILVDASMPEVDGYEFVKRLRRMHHGGRPRIVFCLCENSISHVARATHSGANDILLKPFDREMIRSKFAKTAAE